jgi:two-component system, cell cycle sensor histidine kinase DivJ
VGFHTSVRNYLDTLVHPAARGDVLTAARHRAFIAPRLFGSCAALAIVPVYLALRGMPSGLEVIVFGWLLAPLLLAFFLSRTGRYDTAHILSALALTGLITFLAWRGGGIGSFAAIWLVLVPLEAALSASRRVVALAAVFALTAAVILLLAAPADLSAGGEGGLLAVLGLVSAALYGIGLALNAQSLARAGLGLFHAEENRYRLLARHMTDVISRHGRNGAVLFISPAAEALFGAAPVELTGLGLFDRVHVADRPAYRTALADAARGETRSVEFRVRGDALGAASFLWVEMRCHPLEPAPSGARGSEREVVAVLRDVSERKRQEQALLDARVEADHANAGKSRFLATVSHELRTPLNAIIGFSEMLNNDTLELSVERRAEYADLISGSGRHLLSVVNGILDMSKMDSGSFEITPERFAPGEAVAGCCELLATKAREAGIDLRVKMPDTLPDIVADQRALKQILINLVSNAIKFTDRGGRVSVEVGEAGDCLALLVEDSGVGIDETDLPRLGEAFFQARASYDRRHDGTGLGLSIVQGLVRLHGGSIDIRSRVGEGTRVSVRLPLDCEGKRAPVTPIVLKPKTTEAPRAAAERQVRKRA